MKIGELAAVTGCSIETIRYYERSGLLAAPRRSAGNYRVYNADHQERLAFIRHCRLLDISLEEIRRLSHFRDSPNEACDEVNTMLDTHLANVRMRIASMRKLETQLVSLRSCCSQAQQAAQCGILHVLGHVV